MKVRWWKKSGTTSFSDRADLIQLKIIRNSQHTALLGLFATFFLFRQLHILGSPQDLAKTTKAKYLIRISPCSMILLEDVLYHMRKAPGCN